MTTHATTATYQAAAKPFRQGQTRKKSWRTLYGTKATDKLWFERCAQYWRTQERKFGVKFNDFQIAMLDDPPPAPGAPATTIVTTWATVAEVLPGSRV